MKLDVRAVMKNDGEVLQFDFTMPLSGDLLGRADVSFSEATVRGDVKNTAGAVTLSFAASTTLSGVCDRCLKPVCKTVTADYSVFLAYEKQNADNDAVLVIEGDTVDLEELVYDTVYLNLPAKMLCTPECKGLCAKCGKDLNEGACDCGKGYINPAFAALKDQLK